jgi:predicted Zn-dependent protease
LSQVIKRDREDVDARYERALLLAELSEHRKALEGLEAVRQARPADPEVAKHVARLYYRTSQHDKAAESLRAFMKMYPDATDLTHVNLLAELLCSSEISQWQEVIELMNTTRTQLLGEGEEMPVELMAKEAVARAHLGDVEGAAEQLKAVLAQPVDVFADVYAAAADAMEHVARDDLAEPFLRALATDSATAEPAWCQRLAENQRRLVGPAAAAHVWQAYADALPPDHPYYMDVVVCLADALKHAGDDAGATAALRKLDGSLLAAVVEPGNEAPDGSQAVVSAAAAGAAAAKVGGGAGATIAPATRTAETDLLHKAKLLKECGRRDLIVKLALPSLTGTLTALATDDKALDARRASNKTRGKPRERGGGVGGGGGGGGVSIEEEPAAVFVGYVTKHRRRSRKKPAPEGAETDEEGGGADAGQGGAEPAKVAPSGVEGMEADVEPAQPHIGSTREDAASNAPLLPSLLKSEEPFELMIDTCLGLLAAKRSDEARRLAQTAVDVLGKRCTNRRKRDTMRLMLSCACLESGDLAAALSALREPAKRWPASPFIWNTFSRVLIAAGGPRQTIKFLIPLRTKHPSSLPLTLELGHTFLQTGQYGAALNEYFQACRQAPDEPLVLLSTGAALLNLAASRFAPDRHANVVQAFAFIQEYARFRNDDAEAYYNVGRAAQQLTLNSFAVDMYKKALSVSVERSAAAATAMDMDAGAAADAAADVAGSGNGGGGEGRDAAGHGKFEPTPYQDVSVQDEAALRYCQSYDVAPEAAYNMALILKTSDATALARKLMRQHLTF